MEGMDVQADANGGDEIDRLQQIEGYLDLDSECKL